MQERVAHTLGAARRRRSTLKLGPEMNARLRELMRRDDAVSIRRIALHVVIHAVGAVAIVLVRDTASRVAIAALLGQNILSFGAIQHECNHNNLFRSARHNLWAGRFASWLLLVPFTAFTELHRRHHEHLGIPGRDPDEWYYRGGPYQVFARELCYAFVYLKNATFNDFDPASKRRIAAEATFNVASWSALGVVALRGHVADILFFVLVAPLLIALAVYNPITRAAEHYGMACLAPGDPRRRDLELNTSTSTHGYFKFWLLNATYHVEHHLYPFVPFQNLSTLHGLLRDKQYRVEPYPLATASTCRRELRAEPTPSRIHHGTPS